MDKGFGLYSLLPPLVAIAAAFALKEPLIALLIGAWIGSSMFFGGPLAGLLRLLDHHVAGAVADPDHAAILVFTLMLGGVVGVMSASGGMRAVVDRISRRAVTPRAGVLSAWLLGLVIFFDDYANTLLVGQSMRPVTDKLKVSREKLSFVVDSTAAPVAAVFPISTWVGYEVALITAAFRDLGLHGDPYIVFLKSVPYRFYGLLTILFVFLIGWTRRDFGPMLTAERRARRGELLAKDAEPLSQPEEAVKGGRHGVRSPFWGLFPIAMVIAATAAGVFISGMMKAGPGVPLWKCLSEANSLHVLLWAAFAGSAAAVAVAVVSRAMDLKDAMNAWVKGCQSMVTAVVILTLAWSLGSVCKDLKTADALIGITHSFPVALIPAGVMVLSGFVSFITGTSWGTMAILYPIAIPLAHKLSVLNGVPQEPILLGAIGSILAGSVFGDHCSPISDTTILSSIGSSCDHMDHVRTQMPYALTVGGVSVLGCVLAGYGASPFWCLALGAAVLVTIVRYLGKKV